MRGGAKVVIEPHRHAGVFIARGKEDALVTLNMTPGKAVYGEKNVKVDVSAERASERATPSALPTHQLHTPTRPKVLTHPPHTPLLQGPDGNKIEYRVWNPFRSKLAAAILGGVENIWMPPGSKVLYLGAASGTTVSHVSDIVGPVCSNPTFPLPTSRARQVTHH